MKLPNYDYWKLDNGEDADDFDEIEARETQADFEEDW